LLGRFYAVVMVCSSWLLWCSKSCRVARAS